MATFRLTAQNIDIYEGDGFDAYARTGGTSAEQVYRAGAQGVILGHSEAGDSPEVTRKKLLTIIKKANGSPDYLNHLTVLVGESWDEFEGKLPEEVANLVTEHLNYIVDGLPAAFVEHLVVGYEPKWGSRGSGRDDMPPPAPALVVLVAKHLREALAGKFAEKGREIPIIYGGRSTPERTAEILVGEDVEGLILGSACNSVAKTLAIAKSMEESRPGKRKILHANFKAYDLPDSYGEYVRQLGELDETFNIYLSPSHTDLRAVRKR